MGELVQSHVVRRLLAEAADERGPAQHDRVARHETADELMARGTAIVLVERRRIDEDLGQVGVLPARSPEHEHHRAARDQDADFVGHGGVDAGDLGVVDEDRDVALEARALVQAQRRVVPDVALQRAPPRRGELARGDATPSQRAMQQHHATPPPTDGGATTTAASGAPSSQSRPKMTVAAAVATAAASTASARCHVIRRAA